MKPLPVLLALALTTPVSAALGQSSAAAAWLMHEELGGACPGGGGRIDPASFIEQDLTGDGRADLIVAHEGIRCAAGGRSAFCGAQLCGFNVYVRRGDLLELEREMLGLDVRVGPDGTIRWHGLGGAHRSMRWTGAGFE